MNERETMLQVGQILGGRYRMVSEGEPLDIGVEYKAYDSKLERLTVVTILDRNFGADAESVARLAEVQQALIDLNEPALPPLEELGLVEGQLYLVRSPLDDYSLASLLAQSNMLDVQDVVEIALALCQALAPLHRKGLSHGGLAPHSVLVNDEGDITLIDTGVLPALRSDSAVPDQPWGRLPYISPEQAAGHTIQAASDVYVVGLLMYQLLAGRFPFRGGDETMTALQHMRYDPPSLQVLVPDIPPPLAQIVHMALSKEPAARYRNAGQLGHILSTQLDALTESPQLVPALGAMPSGPMVVPPPPPLMQERSYDEDLGVDWIMVALLGMALIAVLGLIPLWRTVYRRYAIPSPPPASGAYHMAQPDLPWALPGDDSQGWWVVEQAEEHDG
jgi:serine/threonine protein kinase